MNDTVYLLSSIKRLSCYRDRVSSGSTHPFVSQPDTKNVDTLPEPVLAVGLLSRLITHDAFHGRGRSCRLPSSHYAGKSASEVYKGVTA